MDDSEFRKRGKEMVDYIADYMLTIERKNVSPNVKPGFLLDLLPTEPPENGQKWISLMEDVDKTIVSGLFHFQHPGNHGYFPLGNSFPSILGNMLADSLGTGSMTWMMNPAGTEIEMLVCDWLAKMIGLPFDFLHASSLGGGVIQSGASEAILLAMFAARQAALSKLKRQFPSLEDGVLASKLVGYCSKLVHYCVEKAATILLVKIRQLDTDEDFSLTGETLQEAIIRDTKHGLTPFFVVGVVGTTSVCSYDKLLEISAVCKEEDMWLHVDGAYAGNSLICPELRYIASGIENANSININPSKLLLTQIDSAILWFRNKEELTGALFADPSYLPNANNKTVNFRNWGITLTRRFRALKIWCVISSYGVKGLQEHVRMAVRLAKKFEELAREDCRFEVIGRVTLGMVCFRFQDDNKLTEALLDQINKTKRVLLTSALVDNKFVIRFVICSESTTHIHITETWKIVQEAASMVNGLFNKGNYGTKETD